MAKGRVILEIDFDSGDYSFEIKNLDDPGTGLPLAPIQAAFEQIVGGTFRVTQAALPHLMEKRGKIVNVLAAAVLGRGKAGGQARKGI